MFKKDVLDHFGSWTAVWKALGYTSGAVSQWGDIIPKVAALELHRITEGALPYDPTLYQKAA